MADKPINQAPEETSAIYSIYGRKNNSTNDLVQYPESQIAHAVGKTASNKGETPYIDANGDYSDLTIGANGALKYVSSGLPAWLAIGSTDQVLTVSGGAPVWVSPVLKQISSQTISGAVTSVVFTNIPSSGFSKFLVVGSKVVGSQAATSTSISLQVSTDNGSTFKTTSGDYCNATAARTALISSVDIAGSTSTFQHGSFNLELTGLGNSGRATSGAVLWSSNGISTTNIPSPTVSSLGATRSAAEADNAFRIIPASGNLTAGTITLYGVTEA